ncbi:MAG: DEAD/DEAH box helicase [Magnetococcales bacterium]|nr:DEAD/DEAH box helicase [Magnetococcales bacterium]
MIVIPVDPAPQEALLTRIRTLSPDASMVLGMKALVGPLHAGSRDDFLRLMLATGTDSSTGKSWSSPLLSSILTDLREAALLDNRLACSNKVVLHLATLEILKSSRADIYYQAVIKTFPMTGSHGYRDDIMSNSSTLRRLRLAVYVNDEVTYTLLRDRYEKAYRYLSHLDHFLADHFLSVNLDAAWFDSREAAIRDDLLGYKINYYLSYGKRPLDYPSLASCFRERLAQSTSPEVVAHFSGLELIAGNLEGLQRQLERLNESQEGMRICIRGGLALLRGDMAGAVGHFRMALKKSRSETRRRRYFPGDIWGLCHLMAMFGSNDATLHEQIQEGLLAGIGDTAYFRSGFQALQALLWLIQGQESKARSVLQQLRLTMPVEPFSAACVCLAEYFLDPALAAKHREDNQRRQKALQGVLPLLAHLHGCILARLDGIPVPESPWFDFTTLVHMQEPWERAFEGLATFLRSGRTEAVPPVTRNTTKRLAWFVDPNEGRVTVMEQSFRQRGGWSEGRAVALKRLFQRDERLDYLTSEDLAVVRTLRMENLSWNSGVEYDFDHDKALLALVGHPVLFDARNRDRKVELVRYPVELVVNDTPRGYRIGLSHVAEIPKVFIEEESPGRFRLIEFTAPLVGLKAILGNHGLEVPKALKDRLMDLFQEQGLALPVRAETVDVEIDAVDGDATPIVQLRPRETGLQVALQVRPGGEGGHAFIPGKGAATVLMQENGRHRRIRRNLKEEQNNVAALVEALPGLQGLLDGGFEAVTDTLEASLELLLAFQESTLPVRVEWPEGKPLRVTPSLGGKQLALHLKQSRDWFHIDGEIRVDEGQVLLMRELLERFERAEGRFVPLDDGRFMTLTNHFRHQLERLKAVTEAEKEGRRLAPLGSMALQELMEEAGEVKSDRAWKALQQRLRQAGAHQPELPTTLQAELRDYQMEGFVWMSRLAFWGAGACLADDMGLGKTVQAIAVMLEQAPHGPCLVTAPTSVCHNWERELSRFAPSLKVVNLAGSTVSERAGLLESMGAMTVLVTSYGLLAVEEERLAKVTWRMLVLDEAQAIKNAETRRAQASRKLRAAFRLALSGTPIENYLDELWSLFNVINPGLLGSRESFQRRFAAPIEKGRHPAALQALRAMVRPFILRRTKSMVLAELPPRTDVTLEVELPEEERAFQEALRRQALEALESLNEVDPGQRRFRILTEITRLRRACCHPGLVDPETPLPGAKLALFLELAEELIRNRHKALVFSQFVGQLEKVRTALNERGVRYQYLDGSTPVREREKRVDAFQAGEGDLFLISLKAGGLGLNLTAADYVIHLDPWWNPAVEDQASDRAHRIGQERPVTVYRLIVRESIEEKILQMHREKRDLADSLLEGSDTAVRLTEEDLLALIRG